MRSRLVSLTPARGATPHRSDAELREIYSDLITDPDRRIVAYCRIGERSSHTWFVLHELLDQPDVVNYDGSWVEYGSLIGVPVER